jgi:hypothetical protein
LPFCGENSNFFFLKLSSESLFWLSESFLLLLKIVQKTLKISVADPGSGDFLTAGSGMGRKSGSGSGMKNPNHIFECLEPFFGVKILKFFEADSGSVMEKTRIRDKHFGSVPLLKIVPKSRL